MSSLESSVLTTALGLTECTENLRSLVKRRLENRGKPDQPGFEEWLSFLVNAAFVSSAKQSPFASFEWKTKPGPTAQELAWFVDVLGKTIFAECALTLQTTPPIAASAEEIPRI
jgi:hypothetical protein